MYDDLSPAMVYAMAAEDADLKRSEEAALRLLDRFHLTEPPINPVSISRQLGMKVHFVSLAESERDVSGYLDLEDDSISVNRRESPLRQTFTVAHELGHKILHSDWASSSEYKVYRRQRAYGSKEVEADTFAANLLMPRFLLDQYYDLLPVEGLSQLFAVSVPAMNTRLSILYGL